MNSKQNDNGTYVMKSELCFFGKRVHGCEATKNSIITYTLSIRVPSFNLRKDAEKIQNYT